MREIVHLQAGQCGNQIGSKVTVRCWLSERDFLCHQSLACRLCLPLLFTLW